MTGVRWHHEPSKESKGPVGSVFKTPCLELQAANPGLTRDEP